MKFNKKDKINILILFSILAIIILLLTRFKYIYGSTLDWEVQHSVIPNYFRTLFLNDFNFFPDFAMNIGSGQNIYNLSYYGLYNPIILVSYLLPFIEMKDYIQITSLISLFSSVILFYYFIRTLKYTEKESFFTSFFFMTASSITFHSHRHIMFMNYMPFLILALICVDKYFKGNKKWLCISTLLIILTSYYYSIPAIITIILYGIYRYINITKNITFKQFIKDGLKFIQPIIIAIIISSILIIPTFYTLLYSRAQTNVTITLFDIIVPKINIIYLLYNPYGVGLTSFSLISLLILIKDKKTENKFLALSLLSVITFPIIIYLLNATMYLDSKVLIPFLPLYCISLANLIQNTLNNKIDIKYLIISSFLLLSIITILKSYYNPYFYLEFIISLIILILAIKFKKSNIFLISISIFLPIYMYITNSKDNLVKIDKYKNIDAINQIELAKNIKDELTHSEFLINNFENTNNIFNNLNIYTTNIYSSIINKNYNEFYFRDFNNSMQHRNSAIMDANSNIMFLMFSNIEYIISKYDIIGYTKIKEKGNIKLYRNKDVLPFMYISHNTMDEKQYDRYKFPFNNDILLRYTIVKNKKEYTTYNSNIKEVNIDFNKMKYNNNEIEINNNTIKVYKNNSKITINLDDEYKNKILYISFDIKPQDCKDGDLFIKINTYKNKLTCKQWKYYNNNTSFDYVISDKDLSKLNIEFYKGIYNINNLKIYYQDYNNIKNISDNITRLTSIKKIKSNHINAQITLDNNGYFITTFPFDKGYQIKIDGKEIEYENVNKGYLGFKINKGHHNIDIIYNAPYKKISLVVSTIGIILYIIYIKKRN